MSAERCFNCSRLVSDKLNKCPHCNIERPFDKAFHEARVQQEKIELMQREIEDKRKREEAKSFEEVFDTRESKDIVLEDSLYECEDCQTNSKWNGVIGSPCPTCGNPNTIRCAYPGCCDEIAVGIKRIDGFWHPLCSMHLGSEINKCSRCGEWSFSLVVDMAHEEKEYLVHANRYICDVILRNKRDRLNLAKSAVEQNALSACPVCGKQMSYGQCTECLFLSNRSESEFRENETWKISQDVEPVPYGRIIVSSIAKIIILCGGFSATCALCT